MPPNLPLLCCWNCLNSCWIDEAGMRIEPFQSAVDHVLDELSALGVEFGHVILINLAERIDEQLYQFVVLIAIVDGRALYEIANPRKTTSGIPTTQGTVEYRDMTAGTS